MSSNFFEKISVGKFFDAVSFFHCCGEAKTSNMSQWSSRLGETVARFVSVRSESTFWCSKCSGRKRRKRAETNHATFSKPVLRLQVLRKDRATGYGAGSRSFAEDTCQFPHHCQIGKSFSGIGKNPDPGFGFSGGKQPVEKINKLRTVDETGIDEAVQ